jgi:hypothetical protein
MQRLARNDIRYNKARRDLLPFAGSIPHEDLEAMTQAIEEGCEQVNGDEW